MPGGSIRLIILYCMTSRGVLINNKSYQWSSFAFILINQIMEACWSQYSRQAKRILLGFKVEVKKKTLFRRVAESMWMMTDPRLAS